MAMGVGPSKTMGEVEVMVSADGQMAKLKGDDVLFEMACHYQTEDMVDDDVRRDRYFPPALPALSHPFPPPPIPPLSYSPLSNHSDPFLIPFVPSTPSHLIPSLIIPSHLLPALATQLPRYCHAIATLPPRCCHRIPSLSYSSDIIPPHPFPSHSTASHLSPYLS